MTGILILFLILVTGFIASMYLPIRFDVAFRSDGKDDHIKVQMSVFGKFIQYKTEIPVIELDTFFLQPILKMEADIENVASDPIEDKGMIIKVPIIKIIRKLPALIKDGMYYLKRYKEVLYGLLKSVRCYRLKWVTGIGLGNPANTGVAIGLIWGIKGLLFSVFNSNIGKMVESPELRVIPCFNNTCMRLDFHCIFDMRIGHIIIAGLKFVKLRFKP